MMVINKYIVKTLNYRVLYAPNTKVLSDKRVKMLSLIFELLLRFWVLFNNMFGKIANFYLGEIQFVDILAVISFCII